MDYQRPLKTIEDYQRLSKTIKDYQRLSKTIEYYRRPLKTIKDYWRLLKTIHNQQRLSKLRKDFQRLLTTIQDYQGLLKVFKDHKRLSKTMLQEFKSLVIESVQDCRKGWICEINERRRRLSVIRCVVVLSQVLVESPGQSCRRHSRRNWKIHQEQWSKWGKCNFVTRQFGGHLSVHSVCNPQIILLKLPRAR